MRFTEIRFLSGKFEEPKIINRIPCLQPLLLLHGNIPDSIPFYLTAIGTLADSSNTPRSFFNNGSDTSATDYALLIWATNNLNIFTGLFSIGYVIISISSLWVSGSYIIEHSSVETTSAQQLESQVFPSHFSHQLSGTIIQWVFSWKSLFVNLLQK